MKIIHSIIIACFFITVGSAISGGLAMFGPPMLMISAQSGGGGGGGGGGGNVACDYGPNITLPAPSTVVGADLATAWGANLHCVLNANFTDTSGAAAPNGWVMNNLNTWLNECPGPTPTNTVGKFWFMWNYANSGSADSGHAPCNRINLITDPTFGGQTLSFSFSGSDIVAGSHQGFILLWPLCGNFCNNNGIFGPGMPNAKYFEITYRLAPNSCNQAPKNNICNNVEDLISNNDPHFSSCPGWMDPVFNEAAGGGGGTSWDNYGCVNGAAAKTTSGGTWTNGFDYANYHTYAWLMTTNGNYQTATAYDVCAYIDGVIVPYTSVGGHDNSDCNHYTNFVAGELQGHNMHQDIFIGDFTSGTAAPSDIPNPLTAYIKSWRLITCANYIGVGNDCGGNLVFHQ